MPFGYTGTILRVDLNSQEISTEHPDALFYRRYMGGWGFIANFLLREVKPRSDPLGPDNKLIIAPGVVTGAPVAGSGRGAIGAKSPLTNAFGAAEGGGYFSAVLKHAGYDGIIVEGISKNPVYLWIQDGKAVLQGADALWGLDVGETLDRIRAEQKCPTARAAMIGPAGENLARISCIMDGTLDAYGRTGLGAVMGSKKLKAVAASASPVVNVADAAKLGEFGRKLIPRLKDNQLHLWGTGGDLTAGVVSGNLPTRNFRDAGFANPKRMSSMYWKEQGELIGMEGCYACPMRCKKVVKADAPWKIDPRFGGPEYEAEASLGSNCGVEDEKALFKANELCNRNGLDVIETGATIAFAMECYENGILGPKETDGIELRFGNGEAVVKTVEMIANRRKIGDLLAEGSMRAASKLGGDAIKYAIHVKGQEVAMHEPRLKRAQGVGNAVSPTGGEHCMNLHDTSFVTEKGIEDMKPFGVLEPLSIEDLGPRKIQMLIYRQQWVAMMSSVGFCIFPPFNPQELGEIVSAVTGWNTSVMELMEMGRRALAMARVFNLREGFSEKDDWLPPRFFTPQTSGPLSTTVVNPVELKEGIRTYYETMGWDRETGIPKRSTLEQLGIGWTADLLP